MDTKEFKDVIEDIVDARISKKGITKFVSAVVKTVNSDGSVDVYLPPDTEKIVSGVLNKTGEKLSVGDSVELCTKNGKTSNAWVSVKHGTNFSGGEQTDDTGWLFTASWSSSDLGVWYNHGVDGALHGRKVGNIVELVSAFKFNGKFDDLTIFKLNEAFKPKIRIFAVLKLVDIESSDGVSCYVSINTNGNINIEDWDALHKIEYSPSALYLYGNIMYFV